MKKNKMMRLASSLLVAVLLTTSVISGTFAKYVTSDEASDSARVAKWGVTVDVKGDAFGEAYAEGTDSVEVIYDTETATVKASTSDKENVLAPGTTGTLVSIDVEGKPEVEVEIETVATLVMTGWAVDVTDDNTDNPVYYCPVEITVGSNTYSGNSYSSIDDFVSAVLGAINSNTTYNPNDDLSAVKDLNVTWKWKFDGNDDVKDTALGNLGNAPTISFTCKVTATQVD